MTVSTVPSSGLPAWQGRSAGPDFSAMRNRGKNRLGRSPLGTPRASLLGAGASPTDAEVKRIVCPHSAAAADTHDAEPWCFFGYSVGLGSRLAATTYDRPCPSGASATHAGTLSGSGCRGIRVSAFLWAGLGCSGSLGLLTQGRFLGGNALSGFSSILATQNGPQRSVPIQPEGLDRGFGEAQALSGSPTERVQYVSRETPFFLTLWRLKYLS